jgi:hypothetical protein
MSASADGGFLVGPTDPRILADASGATWMLSGGVVSRDGVATVSAGVVLLLWFGGIIYQEAHGSWWSWINSTWASIAADPRPVAPPAPPAPPTPAPPTFTQVLAPGQSIAVSSTGSMTVTISA